MLTVHEVAKLAGVSARTLRYYDQVGLLSPAEVSPAGYRLYNMEALKRLQQILFLRELDFPLRDIGPMLSMEAADRRQAVRRHRDLLTGQKERLQGLIDLCGRILNGEDEMSLGEFNAAKLQQERNAYADEVKQRWGDTDAYRESEKRSQNYDDAQWQTIHTEQEAILHAFAALVGHNPADAQVQATLQDWQDFITKRFYPCTDDILRGLGLMYAADERFQKTLNQFGAGTAKLMSDAIAVKLP